jgi:Ca-activated chloride channel family protein
MSMSALFGYVLHGLSWGAAAGLAALGTAAVVALYLVREKERRVRVAFVPLWEPEAGSRRIERLGRRLRRWLSLALQLVLLWLLLIALADPRPAATAPAARSWVVLIDRSASMAARFERADRMAEARRKAHRVVAALGAEDRAMVASFAGEITAETGFEVDGRVLDRAIDRVGVGDGGADIGRAVAFAAAVLRGRPRPTIVVVSDGVADVPVPEPEVRWLPVGTPGGNVALLSLSARRRAQDQATVDLTLVVENFSASPVSATAEVRAGERLLERVPLPLAAHERVVRTVATTVTGQVEARLAVPGENLLASDDGASAAVGEQRRRRVLVVGAANLYLDGALLSFGSALTLERLAPARAEAARAKWTDYDLVLFDGVAPAPPPASGRYLYLDPQGPGSPWAVRGVIRDPVLSDADRRHPLLAQLALSDLNIREARRLVLGSEDQAVASSLGTPLIVARARPGLKMVGVAFDVRRSDLPLRPSFPLLLANSFDWLDDRPAPGATAAGSRRADAAESDTTRAPALSLGGRPLPAWTVPAPVRRRPWGTLALVAALALSLVEWGTHHRRWTV